MKTETTQPHSPVVMCLNVSFDLFSQIENDILTFQNGIISYSMSRFHVVLSNPLFYCKMKFGLFWRAHVRACAHTYI